ncbi:hypothetical protein SAMN04488029_2036 [Reichenbachiella faecimaris]|uniref:Uncharacterized protein n=1 Tax=Reichenbachiella faecimaris TaxID=692418 RepID=A0A1W2GDT4_REIFA|nr:hypothetical protein [Reichenbachiella faecimaris]SMD34488.1 hypothetical protein SAMN04488029_2036 [Reichenbachiella faecimaris]
MVWHRRIYFLLFFTLSAGLAQAQYFRFSPEPDQFVEDVVRNIEAIGTEPAKKVAYDFRNAWTSSINDDQKASIIELCRKMEDRRFATRPYHEYFFSLITYALTQENANPAELSEILDICHYAVDQYERKEVAEFFKSLTFFFARGALYHSHYNKLSTSGGSYKVVLLEENLPEQEATEAPVEEEEFISEEEIVQEEPASENWGADDGWGSDDGWGADDGDDGWGSNDGWGSDDSFGGGDSFGSEEVVETPTEEKKPLVLERQVYSLEKIDHVAEMQANDKDPILAGPALQLTGIEFKIATPYDTLTVTNASGTFLLKDQTFVGTSGEVDWPNDLRGTDGAVVILEGYTFNVKFPRLKTSRAKLKYPELFNGEAPGAFYFKSGKRLVHEEKLYPQFISHYSDLELSLSDDHLKYKGGFAMKGAKKFGASVSKNPSTIEGLGKGRSFTAKAEEYAFEDSLILSNEASFVLYHGSDSIYHHAVRFDYDQAISKLTLLKDRGEYKNTYFFSSFFKLEFKADMIEWQLESDSIDISILNAKNIVPALFESEEYFNPLRYKKMTGLYEFHPVRAVVEFARLVQSSEYNLLEMQEHFGIKPELAASAMHFLKQNNYILFDEENLQIKVLRKAFHYVMAYTKQKDFDNILISSLNPKGSNASLNFETGEMEVRGVSRIVVTPDEDVRITPDSSRITLLKDKDIKFSGGVNAGDFSYQGKDFFFNYDEYLIQMPVIDSMRIQVDFHDGDESHKTSLSNHLTQTSGTLYINHPKNKAGVREYAQYPFFVSDSEAIVYFDSPDILDGAYDKSIYFVVPPFEMDSINRDDPEGIAFKGTFFSGGIIPPIAENLIIMPDRSLGFEHIIPTEGYPLYKGEGILYDSLSLNADGLRADGRIDYRTTTVNSDDFIFYMDSVSAVGQEGIIREGKMDEASYPEAVLADYKMLWKPLKDSMYIANRNEPFQFYNATASLDGKANITAAGVYGSGTMLSRGSRSISDEFHFSQYEYSSRHAEFEILTDNPDKPAMKGDDIALNFNLLDNIATVRPEQEGVAAIGFPYAQMKTSITEATWYLDSDRIAMVKPEEVDIMSSYFYTTREELDSLAFNATNAFYDINTFELNIQGIPYIKVADAEIIPDQNETTIYENAVLRPFENAKLKIDTLNGYHNLFDGHITVISSKKFEGYATYELVNAAQDTFAIKFDSFELKGFQVGRNKYDSMTVSGGTVLESQKLQPSPGFFFAGDVTMYADRKNLEMEGQVKPHIKSLGEFDYWINYNVPEGQDQVIIDVDTATTITGQPIVAGLLYNSVSYELYMSYVHDKIRDADEYVFKAGGLLSYVDSLKEFRIEDPTKTSNESYAGRSFIYNDSTRQLLFEGPASFIKNVPEFSMEATVLGYAKPDSNTYFMDAMLALDMKLHPTVITSMTANITDIVAQIGPDVAHSNSIEVMYKLADMIGDAATKNYENNFMNEYMALAESSPSVTKTLFISNVDLAWSHRHRAFYNTSKLGLSHILQTDINALSDGFLEIKKSDDGDDIVHLFLQIAPSTWYFFSYEHSRLMMYSSNNDFNNFVTENSKIASTGLGEYTTVLGDEFEVLKFVNDFRNRYYGINEAYNLEYPEETHLEEDVYQTIDEGTDAPQEAPVEEDYNTFEELDEDEDDGF